ncbi:MAG TPA: DHHA1 domain-containing protein [Nitrososphaera sp.]|jgi:single-stranded-DNA-specific exonuclease|nr:DHHA1 domain-containing protein [Nitrososphaera sp.]
MPSFCISHKEDVDGICSAALVKAAFDISKVILVDYANLISRLEKVETMFDKIEQLFICDLGLSKKNEQRFTELLQRIVSSGAEVIYIDHHDISKETLHALKKADVTVIRTIEECTSMQVYAKYKKKLPDHAAFFAAMGALTDYMENKPLASTIVSRFDRQFLMLESTALSYMISSSQHDDPFLLKIVETLARMKYPHDIKGGFDIAEKFAKKVAAAVESIKESVVILDNLAYAPSAVELSSSMVVNFVLGSSGKPAAMVYKAKEDVKSYVVSIRGSANCKVHLGRLTNDIASELGGSGGGHERACGAVIPKPNLQKFIETLNRNISDKSDE